MNKKGKSTRKVSEFIEIIRMENGYEVKERFVGSGFARTWVFESMDNLQTWMKENME